MITAIVRFLLTPGTTLDKAKALFEGSTPRYRAAPGLVRKYYLFGEDGSGGGVYLWESREAAERMYRKRGQSERPREKNSRAAAPARCPGGAAASCSAISSSGVRYFQRSPEFRSR